MKKRHDIIPGGSMLRSKRAELYWPAGWPTDFDWCTGVTVSSGGKRYLDMSTMGIGACILGYGDEDVDAAVERAVALGVASSLDCWEGLDALRLLLSLHPWADQGWLTRSGGEAVAVAIRLARARTARSGVAFCGYHGWTDAYAATGLVSQSGVPSCLIDITTTFNYNSTAAFDKCFESFRKNYNGRLAAVVMEPQRSLPPKPGFLEHIRSRCDEEGVALVFDEITTGFRTHCGGQHMALGVEPDLAVFGKAIANGYACAAVIGKEPWMAPAAEDAFISSTSWTERIGPTAMRATIDRLIGIRDGRYGMYWGHLEEIGNAVRRSWGEFAEAEGLPILIEDGHAALASFRFHTGDQHRNMYLQTLYTQEMVKQGVLAWVQFKASFAHEMVHVERFREAAARAFHTVGESFRHPGVEYLEGPVAGAAGISRLVR